MIMTDSTTTCNYEESNYIETKLLHFISENPGIRYRELLRLSNLSNGVLAYHLSLLEDRIQVDRNENKKTTRYYHNNIPITEANMIGRIRHDASMQIVSFILENDLCSFNEVVEHTKKAPPTISWNNINSIWTLPSLPCHR
jgi:predicted transcriptional regulator